jgi:hypothetical protein
VPVVDDVCEQKQIFYFVFFDQRISLDEAPLGVCFLGLGKYLCIFYEGDVKIHDTRQLLQTKDLKVRYSPPQFCFVCVCVCMYVCLSFKFLCAEFRGS